MQEANLSVFSLTIKKQRLRGMVPEVMWIRAYSSVYQNMFQIVDAKCLDDNMEQLAKEVDVIFTATPQGLCASLINEGILSQAKVIDLSADFRIKDRKTYEQWYRSGTQSTAVY